jgi:type I restriction enzyme M protein
MPPDRKQYSKTRPIEIAEFDLEKAWWDDREESEYTWKVTVEEIEARNYNLDIKNPHAVEAGYGDPVKLLADYQARLAEVADLRAQLKDELAAAIERASYAD